MQDGRLEAILRISGELGHYISDAHVPFHTTHNYNGRRSGTTWHSWSLGKHYSRIHMIIGLMTSLFGKSINVVYYCR